MKKVLKVVALVLLLLMMVRALGWVGTLEYDDSAELPYEIEQLFEAEKGE